MRRILNRVDMELVNLEHGQQHSLTLCWVYQAIIQAMAVIWTGDHQSVGILLAGTRMDLGLMYELSRQAIRQGGYNYVGRRTDKSVPFPVAYSRVLSIVGTPVVNSANSSGRGLENIKTYNTTSFVYYSGYDIDSKNLLWLSVGI